MKNDTKQTEALEPPLDHAAGSPTFEVGDRVTLVKSASLPDSMVGRKAIVQGVDPHSDEEYMKYHVIYRMDGKTPIRIGTDTLADEYLDRSNMRLGWDDEFSENTESMRDR